MSKLKEYLNISFRVVCYINRVQLVNSNIAMINKLSWQYNIEHFKVIKHALKINVFRCDLIHASN